MAGRAAIVGDEFLAARDTLRIGLLQMNVGQEVIVFLAQKKTRQQGNLLFVIPITRHTRLRIVSLRSLQPPAQPVGVHLVANASQLWREVSADEITRGVLNSVARGTEQGAIKTLARQQCVVARGEGNISHFFPGIF